MDPTLIVALLSTLISVPGAILACLYIRDIIKKSDKGKSN